MPLNLTPGYVAFKNFHTPLALRRPPQNGEYRLDVRPHAILPILSSDPYHVLVYCGYAGFFTSVGGCFFNSSIARATAFSSCGS